MGRQMHMRYRSLILSCLLFEAASADVSCQQGIDYNNRCNPYNVEFVKLDSNKQKATAKKSTKKSKSTNWFSRSYFNKLLERYSSNYDGRSGLQALIDRSHYGKLRQKQKKKEALAKAKESVKEQKTVTLTTKKIEVNTTKLVQKEQTKTLITKVEKTQETPQIKTPPLENLETNKTVIKAPKETKVAKSTTIKKKTPKKVAKKIEKKSSKKLKVTTYKVQKGDTLSSIATALGVSIKELKKLNNIGKSSTIKVGQALKVPQHLAKKLQKAQEAKAAKAKLAAAKKQREKKLKEMLKKGYYIVQKGDTLSKIAKLTNLSIVQLREYNKIAKSQKIKVGQKLSLKERRIARKSSKSLNYLKNIKFKHAPQLKFKRKIRVIATAYTSHRNQTDSTPFLAAWNNRIRPGMKIIAVSVDLIKKYGLTNGVKVKITGLPGYYVVRDKMNKRLRNHIDIYMGVNKRKALRWGRRRVALYW